jgi:hypothetical protein
MTKKAACCFFSVSGFNDEFFISKISCGLAGSGYGDAGSR